MYTGRQTGYSLIELLVVVFIIALVAAVAMPDLSSGNEQELDLAAQELAAAMKFARSETIRTGLPHGYSLDSVSTRMRVFSLNVSSLPPAPVYDVYHPVTKQLYDFFLDDHPFAANPDITRKAKFSKTCNTPTAVYFDEHGTPRCTDPAEVLVKSDEVILDDDGATRVILLDEITGRISVQ